MALTIGTDAYWDLTSIRDYWSARGNTAWAVETLPDETAEPSCAFPPTTSTASLTRRA